MNRHLCRSSWANVGLAGAAFAGECAKYAEVFPKPSCPRVQVRVGHWSILDKSLILHGLGKPKKEGLNRHSWH